MDFQTGEKTNGGRSVLLPPLLFELTLASDYSSLFFTQKVRS
jgi:hypothetical protein